MAISCLLFKENKGLQVKAKLSRITFMEIDHDIISLVILSLSLVQEGHLSVTG